MAVFNRFVPIAIVLWVEYSSATRYIRTESLNELRKITSNHPSMELIDSLVAEQTYRDVLVPEELISAVSFDHEDISDTITDQIKEMSRDRNNAQFDVGDFNDYEAIMSQLDIWAKSCPIDRECHVKELGITHEKREIKMLSINCKNCAQPNPIITFYSAIHGREWLNTAVLLKIANEFITGNSPKRTQILDKYDIHIIPIVNPDGYAYSWEVPDIEHRFWRKNRAPTKTKDCMGTDINRNFDVKWSLGYRHFEDGNGCSPSHYGQWISSELETQSIIHNKILKYKKINADQKYQIILHGFGRLVMQGPSTHNNLDIYQCYPSCGGPWADDKEAALAFTRTASSISPTEPAWEVGTACKSDAREPFTGQLLDVFTRYKPQYIQSRAFLIGPSPRAPNEGVMTSPFLASKEDIISVFNEIWDGLDSLLKKP